MGVNFSPRNSSFSIAGESESDEKLMIFISVSRGETLPVTKKEFDVVVVVVVVEGTNVIAVASAADSAVDFGVDAEGLCSCLYYVSVA